jgi:hypothetical protein
MLWLISNSTEPLPCWCASTIPPERERWAPDHSRWRLQSKHNARGTREPLAQMKIQPQSLVREPACCLLPAAFCLVIRFSGSNFAVALKALTNFLRIAIIVTWKDQRVSLMMWWKETTVVRLKPATSKAHIWWREAQILPSKGDGNVWRKGQICDFRQLIYSLEDGTYLVRIDGNRRDCSPLSINRVSPHYKL